MTTTLILHMEASWKNCELAVMHIDRLHRTVQKIWFLYAFQAGTVTLSESGVRLFFLKGGHQHRVRGLLHFSVFFLEIQFLVHL